MNLQQAIVASMPLLRILDKFPHRIIPKELREPLRAIISAMEAEKCPDDTEATPWCERRLRQFQAR